MEREILCLKIKQPEKAKTASNFPFPCSERLIFKHINLWFTLGQLTWSDLPRSPKC